MSEHLESRPEKEFTTVPPGEHPAPVQPRATADTSPMVEDSDAEPVQTGVLSAEPGASETAERSGDPLGEFEQMASAEPEIGLFQEFWQFVCENKKWWLLPIIFVLLVMGILLMLSGSAAAPFIYSLF